MNAIIVIPARFGAQRLPAKPLLKETGKYLVQHVYERAKTVKNAARVVVATDDARIADAVRSFGGDSVMTSPDHASGTDRVAEVARNSQIAGSSKNPVIVNVQGDEPEVDPVGVERLIDAMEKDPVIQMGTLAFPMPDEEAYQSPNVVKLVVDAQGFAMYFSRSPIPHIRDAVDRARFKSAGILKHLGVYGFRADFLPKFGQWGPSRLETLEKLEQLRVLERGVKIKVLMAEGDSSGIDTPDDYRRFVERFKKTAR